MTRVRLRHLIVALSALMFTGAVSAAQKLISVPAASPVTVHEWGTFTSVAGEDGGAIEWRPLSGPSDLPCFVRTIPESPKVWYPGGVNGTPATVRMETPVVYFYASEPASVRVRVRFPQGLITEWYPDAQVTPLFGPQYLRDTTSTADWGNVEIVPGATVKFPTEPGDSHYYPARATDASPVRAGGQFEKFLFYRGIGSFPVPLSVRVDAGRLAIDNTSRHDIPHLIVFERRGSKFGYRLATGARGLTTVAAPVLDGTLPALRADLERMLVAQGLFAREAKAMVETWRDSWFEEGTRVFYLLPQAAVDEILPLTIDPAPMSVARAFVGRVEVITPVMLEDVSQAMARRDLLALHQYGRLLSPIAQRLLAKPSAGSPTASLVSTLLQQVAASQVREVPCR